MEIESETLLNKFVKTKLDLRQARQTLGFSDRKYSAALFMLSGVSIKFRTEKLGISYHVYRHWATEPTFKRVVQGFIDEFASLVVQHIKEKVINCTYKDFANLDWTEILDANSYSKPLKKRLEALYLKESKTFNDRRFLFAMSQILNLTGSIPDEEFERLVGKVGQINNAILRLLFMSARAITQKYFLNVADRRFIRQMLNVSEQLIFQ